MDFVILKNAVQNYMTVVGFVDNGELDTILSSIGDVHFEAAKEALAKMGTARNKKAPVQSAITHLEAAHIAYRKLHDGEGADFRAASYALGVNMDMYTLCLMATCYMYLQELELAKECVAKARDVFKGFQAFRNARGSITGGGGHPYGERLNDWQRGVLTTIFNPSQWFKLPRLLEVRMTDQRQREFKEFCRRIESHTITTFLP
jgi:hypothetical protein